MPADPRSRWPLVSMRPNDAADYRAMLTTVRTWTGIPGRNCDGFVTGTVTEPRGEPTVIVLTSTAVTGPITVA